MKQKPLEQVADSILKLKKKIYARTAYPLFVRLLRKRKGSFVKLLNLGLDTSLENAPYLKAEDEVERLQFQLYHKLVETLDLNHKAVLEIGCGRGGGCYYVHEYFNPSEVTGIDLLAGHIKLAKKYYSNRTIKFIQGNASTFLFPLDSIDVILNLESSHIYPDFDAFLKRTYETLKPNGFFSFADVRLTSQLEKLYQSFAHQNFKVIKKENITQEVLSALDKDEERKKEILNKFVLGKRLFSNFSFLKESESYKELQTGNWTYIHILLQK